ncbi:hypothetical protein [Alteromonas sp. a30]|uniref:hypothetical protein n=1 Tax=Alteromonas sp. a30 TaxID=2730917 RepID=UPI0022823F89|nr:hypothetical protein [Alteromonas sp. a30]MCY7293819.1 hypothetical protein [Alteromonas sp. a30]
MELFAGFWEVTHRVFDEMRFKIVLGWIVQADKRLSFDVLITALRQFLRLPLCVKTI